MAKESVKHMEQESPSRTDLEEFNRKIKGELKDIKVHKMKKKNPKKINLLDYIGFIETDEETDCMRDHDLIL